MKQENRRQRPTGSHFDLRTLTQVALLAAVLVVCSQITLPFPGGVPITLQTFAIALIAYLMGPYLGGLTLVIYLGLGAIGLPVFAGFKGGFATLIGPTGGYLLGFLPMVALLGWFPAGVIIKESKKKIVLRCVMALAGLAICHVAGVLRLSAVTGMSLTAAFLAGSAPFIIKDILSIVLAYRIAVAVRRQLNRAAAGPR
ncbi:MAG TPA: biotin transporter BioY [Clostridiaceae bacterium]|nr:biotin transporter BioY [Clostridiaceae bacterium]